MDFMSDEFADGLPLGWLELADHFARESPAVEVGRSLPAAHVFARVDPWRMPTIISTNEAPRRFRPERELLEGVRGGARLRPIRSGSHPRPRGHDIGHVNLAPRVLHCPGYVRCGSETAGARKRRLR